MTTALGIYLAGVLVMSVATFAAYGIDKRRAGQGGRRIAEQTLQTLALMGGWPGALLAQQQFRHKTQKVAFQVVFWLMVLLHVGIVSAVGYVVFRANL